MKFERKCFVMSFFGILLSLAGICVSIWGVYVIFRDVIYPIYEERYLQKKYSYDLFDKVRWIALKANLGSIFIDDSRRTMKEVRDRESIEYISREQNNLNIDSNYCIDFSSENETTNIREILDIHKNEVINCLFLDTLKKDKKFYKLDFFEYYMISLFSFLEKNKLKYEDFNNKKMYHKEWSEQEGEWIYKFTEYGIIYYKLYYIVTLFCAKNENLKPLITSCEHTINCIKKNLDKKEITVLYH